MTVCWKCASPIEDRGALVCPSCGVIVPPHPHASPFERLGSLARFDLDEKDLERTWITRSRVVHPDRFARKPDVERRYAAEQTVALNDAWRAIRGAFDRAGVLVKSAGVDTARLDQRLLVQLMEARERAEEGAAEKAAVIAESTSRFHQLMADVAPLLGNLDDRPRVARAAGVLAEAKTLARLVDDLGGGRLIPSLEGR